MQEREVEGGKKEKSMANDSVTDRLGLPIELPFGELCTLWRQRHLLLVSCCLKGAWELGSLGAWASGFELQASAVAVGGVIVMLVMRVSDPALGVGPFGHCLEDKVGADLQPLLVNWGLVGVVYRGIFTSLGLGRLV